MSDSACAPGDIVVGPVFGGWVLGRVMPERGPGPWWEYVDVAPELTAAVERAREIACAVGTRVWMHEGGERYWQVPSAP